MELDWSLQISISDHSDATQGATMLPRRALSFTAILPQVSWAWKSPFESPKLEIFVIGAFWTPETWRIESGEVPKKWIFSKFFSRCSRWTHGGSLHVQRRSDELDAPEPWGRRQRLGGFLDPCPRLFGHEASIKQLDSKKKKKLYKTPMKCWNCSTHQKKTLNFLKVLAEKCCFCWRHWQACAAQLGSSCSWEPWHWRALQTVHVGDVAIAIKEQAASFPFARED